MLNHSKKIHVKSNSNITTSEYYKKNHPLTRFEKLQGYYSHIFSWIPFSQYIFGVFDIPEGIKKPKIWKKILQELKDVNESNNDYSQSIGIRGFLNLHLIYDFITFYYMKYLEDDKNEDYDVKDRWSNSNTNIGILSALLFTIWVSFLLEGPNLPTGSILGYFYILCWTGAVAFTAISTIVTVITVVVSQQTANVSESNFMLEILDFITFGFGPIAPLASLTIGTILAIIGLSLWYAIFFDFAHAIIGISTILFVLPL